MRCSSSSKPGGSSAITRSESALLLGRGRADRGARTIPLGAGSVRGPRGFGDRSGSGQTGPYEASFRLCFGPVAALPAGGFCAIATLAPPEGRSAGLLVWRALPAPAAVLSRKLDPVGVVPLGLLGLAIVPAGTPRRRGLRQFRTSPRAMAPEGFGLDAAGTKKTPPAAGSTGEDSALVAGAV